MKISVSSKDMFVPIKKNSDTNEYVFQFDIHIEDELMYVEQETSNVVLPNYDKLVSAFIHCKYSVDEEIALLNNYAVSPDEYEVEYEAYQSFRLFVKDAVRKYLRIEPTLEDAQENKIAEITCYDKSTSVNEFTLYGTPMWLDKSTRVGLVNAVNSAKVLGNDNVTLGLGGHTYTLPCDTALAMLASLEMYALACYNVTLAHKNAVKALETIEAVEAYDYTTGYPEKLTFE